ncbi:MAG: hypothetical protein MJZ16_10515, partial [Bacteroidales bacterium]|nr:hypothetical protein [Bacteroidales bacterium]
MKKIVLSLLMLSVASFSYAQTAEGSISTFRKPAPEIEAITMAAPLPSKYYSNDYKKLVVGYSASRSVPIAELAASEIRLAGLRVDPQTFTLTREAYLDNLELIDVATGAPKAVTGIPAGAKIKNVTWSQTGKYFAFTVTTPKGMGLYRVDASSSSLAAQKINTHRLNAVLGTPYMFLDDTRILYKTVPDGNTSMPVQTLATSNVIQETQGIKKSSLRTYEDLLTGPFDEIVYDYVATSILALYDGNSSKLIGEPAIYRSLDPSPDRQHI